MSIHIRIKQLRQEKGWSQANLAERVGIRQKQISTYETGVNHPSTDILIRLAEVFDVSLDYLALDSQGESTKIQVKDRELLRYFEKIDDYNEGERKVIKDILDLVVIKHDLREMVA